VQEDLPCHNLDAHLQGVERQLAAATDPDCQAALVIVDAAGGLDRCVGAQPQQCVAIACDDASAIILAGDIGLFRPPAWMAATILASSSGERAAVMVTAAPAAAGETAMGAGDTAPGWQSCGREYPTFVSGALSKGMTLRDATIFARVGED
jgi:hypothetical protein